MPCDSDQTPTYLPSQHSDPIVALFPHRHTCHPGGWLARVHGGWGAGHSTAPVNHTTTSPAMGLPMIALPALPPIEGGSVTFSL